MATACREYQPLIFLVFSTLIFGVNPVLAEPVRLSGTKIQMTLNEREVTGTDNGQPSSQIFRANGATFYSVGANQTIGSWKVVDDTYCSVWPPSTNWVCYGVVRDGNVIQFVSPSGTVTAYTLKH